MHRRLKRLWALPALGALVACIALLAPIGLIAPLHASDWPARSVSVVVPFAAGGNTDMMARLGAQHLSTKLGRAFAVENRPGAGDGPGLRSRA
jgi:tripartite-type tricarboxylate transporter receptor subunit TctC